GQGQGQGEESTNGGEEGKEATATRGELPRPKIHSPNFNMIYGQNMFTMKSYQSALFYYFRAYEQNQYDPFICLSIAQAYFGRSMNRQADNKHYQIAQGLAFLTRYRKLSAKDAKSQEEVEYNYGRSFHSIGVLHLATVHYERVLASVRSRMDVSQDPEEIRQTSLAFEAAHNLVLIYAAVDSTELVKQRSKWLSL
ncbi:general transcription factor 3C polypeptide 3 (transcription factor C subunit 4), partial [Tremellales sp. Uapishka_1]